MTHSILFFSFGLYRCNTCTTPAKHFHQETPATFQEAVMLIKNYGHNCVSDVPVNIKHSKCFFIHRGKTGELVDVTCDDMPWCLKKGKIMKTYFVKVEGKQVKQCWPESSGSTQNARKVTVHKKKWVHAHEKEASKIIFEIDNEPVVLVQYLGLKDQPTLKLGNRHTKKKTVELIKKEIQKTSSLKRALYNVDEELHKSGDIKGPSSLPTLRTVKYVKQKAKREKISTTTAIMHKMAEDDNFVRVYDVTDNVMSVVLFDNRQLADIKKFCCNDEGYRSSLTVDTTFKFGEYFVVTTSYRHLQLKTVRGNHPVLLGPLMVTHKLERSNYRTLFDTMTRIEPSLSTSLSAFVTDGEKALSNALHESFPTAVGRMCITHIERNIKHCIENKLKLTKSFTYIVLGDLRGNSQHKGLIHCDTYTEFCGNLQQLYSKWNDREREEIPHKEPQFAAYFKKHKAQAVYEHCCTREALELGLVDLIPDNNPPESMHALMRRWQDFKKDDIPNFISAMEKLKHSQQKDVDGAFMSRKGIYAVRDEYSHLKIDPHTLYGEGVNASDAARVGLLEEAKGAPIQVPHHSDEVGMEVQNGSFPDGCLDHLPHIPAQIRSDIITFATVGNGRDGFEEGTMLFKKKKGTVFITRNTRGAYTCDCRTFITYKLCHHVMCHAQKDGNLHGVLQRTRHICNDDVDRIANFNKNPRSGQKQGPPRHRVGRATGSDRKSLQESLPERQKTYYAEAIGDGVKMKIRVANPAPALTGVNERCEKPQLVPTLGNPFTVKNVHGNIRICFGCKGSLNTERLCVAHKQSDLYYNVRERKWLPSKPGNKHFHVNAECIKAGNNPGFKMDLLDYEN